MVFVDSHSHINSREFSGDLPAVLERMRSAGVAAATVIGCERGEQNRVIELVRESGSPRLFGAWALHPEYEDVAETSVEEIESICSAPEIAAVGETGLDYHWCKGDLSWQKNRFRMHLTAARNLGKPVIVHAREAEADAVKILAEQKAGDMGFVMHCYGGDLDTALACIDAGGMVSFTGTITFKNAGALREVVRALPLESLMIETDCPYMAPVPHRGKRNEPAYVVQVAEQIAAIKELSLDEVARVTTDNYKRFIKKEF
ncbi:MAG: TatD family hydrolase [Duodenibacillus sp.]|nr:TatD family hydrolase [Duodenibacillus sp.]